MFSSLSFFLFLPHFFFFLSLLSFCRFLFFSLLSVSKHWQIYNFLNKIKQYNNKKNKNDRDKSLQLEKHNKHDKWHHRCLDSGDAILLCQGKFFLKLLFLILNEKKNLILTSKIKVWHRAWHSNADIERSNDILFV